MSSLAINSSQENNLSLKGFLAEWWPILLGILALYVPTFIDLANGIWNTEEQAHGPIILVVVVYLIWQQRFALLESPSSTYPVLGGMLLFFALLLYTLGRSQDVLPFEVGSFAIVLTAILLMLRGRNAISALWFPVAFSLFMVPIPGVIVDAITGSLKQHISLIAENALYYAGYPIGRVGVTITVGQYRLLVADACSGLHSMFSLSALGFLYLYMMRYTNWLRNWTLIASILPIAFAANVIRVILLILVTYHMGDEAGQGFIHGFAGIVLFAVALIFLFFLDTVLGRFRLFQSAPTSSKTGEA